MITILRGDNTELLPTLTPASVQAIVASPPYYGLRDYGIPPTAWPEVEYAPMAGIPPICIPAQVACLGLESDPLAYIAHLVHVFRLARPALADDGVVLLNLGDSYAQDSKWGGASGNKNSNSLDAPRARRQTGLKDKDLLCIPHRTALALQADGWWLRSDIIWHKPNAMPESVTDRPTKAHEYVFLLAKSARYFWDADAVSELAAQPNGAAVLTGQHKRSEIQSLTKSTLGTNQGAERRNLRTVWSIPTRPLADAHYAPMPEALAERCIRAASRVGDTVLDPWGGSGTTARAAERLQRHAIHMEINPGYVEIAERRTNGVQVEMAL